MTRSILKSDGPLMTSSVRSTIEAFSKTDVSPAIPDTTEIDTLRSENTELKQTLLTAQTERASLQAQWQLDLEKVSQEQFDAGQAASTRNFQEANDVLCETLGELPKKLEAALRETEVLASHIAALALKQLSGPSFKVPQIVEAMIAHQINKMTRELILSVEVSSEDFENAPDGQADDLARLVNTEVNLRPDLSSGEARIKLSMGGVELSLDRFVGDLVNMLEKQTLP